jgi:hypothetical protein
MLRLSSKTTFFYKRVFPILWFGILLLVLVGGSVPGLTSGQFPPAPFFLVPVVMGVFGYFLMKKIVFDLVDEVWDAGDALIVRNRRQEDRIALSDIVNVSYEPYMSPPRVTLSLRNTSMFGNKIIFSAPVRFVPFATSPIIDQLIERIDAARRRAR